MKTFSLFSLRPLPVIAAALLGAGGSAAATANEAPPLTQIADQQFAFAAAQYRGLVARIGADPKRVPRTFEHGELRLVDATDWTSGFVPGSLWLIFEQTRDAAIGEAARNLTARLESLQDYTGTHDLGFMIGCSYGQGWRLTREPHYRDVMVRGARSLATRFSPATGVIRSWDFGPWRYPVIVDNMMNLEFLIEAAELSGTAEWRAIAEKHADTTLANHFRPDGSSVHVVDYDPATGAVLKRQTHQGSADDSAWARGQAWALYGYTAMYRLTKKPAYLAQARRIADFVANHPRLPADGVPYWDFDAPEIPQVPRDASAAAILASALIELADFAGPEAAPRYRALAERQLRALASPAYRAALGENGNFLIRHCVGNKPAGSEIDTPLNYADYYFLEALARAKARGW